MVFVRLDPATKELVYASAGHPTCYVLDSSGSIKAYLKRTGFPLGLKQNTTYQPAPPVQLASGDLVLLLTDGIEEAMSEQGELFNMERTLDVLRQCRHQTAKDMVQSLYQAVKDFARNSPQMDDITSIVIKVS